MEFLQYCTVKLSTPQNRNGTGFFVAPGLILTCAHVVKDLGDLPIKVRWKQEHNFAEAKVEESFPKFDLALLRFNPPKDENLPCVKLDEDIKTGDELYTFSYSDIDINGSSVTFTTEGPTGDEPPLIKFKSGQVRPGMSGSALVNQRTGKVCGILKFTRGRSIDLGGGAIPISVILSEFTELKELNQKFHQQDRRWIENMEGTAQTESKGEPSESQDGFIYDAYISYVEKEPDATWVWDTLVPQLEDAELKIATPQDEILGVPRVVNIEKMIEQSKRTVLVLSDAYLEDDWADFQNVLGQTLGIEEGKYRLITLKISEFDDGQLPSRLRTLTPLNLLVHPRRAKSGLTNLIKELRLLLRKR
ncbi:trypsin-like peptidase domain-containing protein [Okeania sp. SIO2B3]|uniref:trypsin-like peptidase domain-containing protein n=1 Tax=Okeania sp. SIO2B3 TaxID=2607784 RepID=UPI0013BEBB1B|nr:trypsin-like peptidase domain-containing protein [Okeania sp. SIO2B3]NET46431.1 TIR domain-containing protein [Okeania sp. SIO2B3]